MFGRRTKQEETAQDTGLFSHILLVVDGSEPALAAADFAVNLARQVGSRITAVYVVDTATMDYLMQMRILIQDERQEFEHDLESSGQRYLEYVRTLADKHDVSQVETELLRGSLHQIILRRARELGVDAIVVGGWKQTITRKDTTSVERQLILSEADCPVVTVKTGARDRSRVETSPRRP